MTKLYVAEYLDLMATPQGDCVLGLAAPPLAENVMDTAAATGAINVLGAITGGSGYTNGTYANVRLTGGTGSGAIANITVAGGAVTAVTLVERGIGYTAADSLSASTGVIGAGTLFAVPVTSVLQQRPLNAQTKVVEVSTDGIASITFGATSIGTVAAATNLRLAANERIIRRVPQGGYVSVIINT